MSSISESCLEMSSGILDSTGSFTHEVSFFFFLFIFFFFFNRKLLGLEAPELAPELRSMHPNPVLNEYSFLETDLVIKAMD